MSRFDSQAELSWDQLQQRLAGRVIDPIGDADGGDGPGFTRKKTPFVAPTLIRPTSTVAYAELHCHSNFSFLDGASSPEDLVTEAVRLGLDALAITDHDGFYGAVQFAGAARAVGLPTVYGVEVSLDLPGAQTGVPDPAGQHLLLLARGQEGYHRLSGMLSTAHLAGGEKGKPVYDLDAMAAGLAGHVIALTGCRKGAVPAALLSQGPTAASRELDRLTALFGPDNVAVELIDHGTPLDGDRNDALADLAAAAGLPVVATGNVHYDAPARGRLAAVIAAVRARTSLDELDPYLPAAATAHLRGGAEQAARFVDFPTAVAHAATLGRECAFDLSLIAPELPPFDVPAGHTEASYLRQLTYEGAQRRYGPRQAHPDAWAQIDHELAMIEDLKFPGYFLVVWDIVRFCASADIYCQGRGSAANSAVCYALRITNVDPVAQRLLFERFLAPERDGPPDIDVDIESDRREEVIQYVYDKHGRRNSALVANVITYRPRSAVRDVARAFGYSPGQQDAWSKQLDRWSDIADDAVDGIPIHVVTYARQLLEAPRHLGIHSGGMVICHREVAEVCPIEHARMDKRTVLQWDKDSAADAGLTKFDLLGLGMLSALHYAFDFLDQTLDLGDLDCSDPEVYAMLCRADSVGVFQVESRAQMSTLPRLKPRTFYDLVVEVGLIRPGPIQGGSVHPYIRRRNGLEQPTYAHPLMRNSLEKTLGVPLWQEQMMQLAVDVAGFTPAEADQLRRAMGSKRSAAKMDALKDRLFAGMAANGITGATADDIFLKLAAFANYGFPESHAMSFAYLVYASAWLKRYHPAPFLAALLKAQPMGFYNPQSLVDDARRHGVQVRRPCINASGAKATLETTADTRWGSAPGEQPHEWGLGGPVVRLGLDQVDTISEDTAKRIIAARDADGPFTSMSDLARRCGLTVGQLEALATADAFASLALGRREALWAAGAAVRDTPDRLPGTVTGMQAPTLPGMTDVDLLVADVVATGLSPDSHPIHLVRGRLDTAGVLPVAHLAGVPDRTRVHVGGLVTHRQRPATARGVTFLSLEDETGILNVVVSEGAWARFGKIAKSSPALVIRGTLQSASGVINLVAEHLSPLPIATTVVSRDFR
ncbi:error-prone DNA polymerase [Catellatospora sichuanensis]|uniref:error-prone DNA polymerase n=1 Tax=Catellatospora sichuanensis TaxID=1969805 RepID=UPI0011846896|nr:error-prone DNA polymerase [Catellatospora sichuanensis]